MKAIPTVPLGALMLAAACGGSPTAPTQAPSAPPAPALFAVTKPGLNGNTVTFNWDAGQTPAFLVEIGHQPGASDVAVIEVDQPTLTWDAPARGVDVEYFVRVRGKNDVGIGPPSNEVRVQSLDVRDFIEALFLSDGPLSVGQPIGFMGGFPVGSQITVRFLNTVQEFQHFEVRELTRGCSEKIVPPGFSRIPCAMGLTFTYSETSDRERILDALQGGPRPPKNEVWVYDRALGCEGGHDVQNFYEAGSPVTWAAIICVPSSADHYETPHGMGHALGFQELPPYPHEQGPAQDPFDLPISLMREGSDQCLLADYEFAAVEAVYAAGLRPGDSRVVSLNLCRS